MNIFYITLLSTYLLSLLARLKRTRLNKSHILLTLVVMAILSVVSGLRSNIGDTEAYVLLYRIVAEGMVSEGSYETGFIIFLSLLNQISEDPQLMIFITALITNCLFIWTLRNYSSLFELQVFMYITSGFYLVTMNGIRQALVAAILFAATKFLVEGRFKLYLVITLIMYTFHTSALIMIPVYFIARQEAWSRRIKIIFFLLPVTFIFFEPIMSLMFQTIEGSRYASYEQAIMTGGEGGANLIRVCIAAVPVIMAYLGRRKLEQEWAGSNVFINMSIINLIVMIFSLYNWLFARFAFFFQPYNFVLLPYMIGSLFRQRQLMYSLFVIFYLIFFYYEHVITLSVNYRSNFF